ncbi:UDP-N-acetylmuramoyl-L-alanine--D-glutamate ligase [Candidatus Sumerlaeota bacterium]|nr:UDP-N-acetylmuramoyl-L-alanine--D-glutamate ligase [Candidatus Sumerlaeota bacterium]
MKEKILNSRIGILGAGRSGMAAARLLATHKVACVVLDDAPAERLSLQQQELERLDVPYYFQNIPQGLIDDIDIVVLSPGIPLSHPFCEQARQKTIQILSELELGYQFASAPIVAVSGTNGKTTTTFLIAKILRLAGFRAKEAGNMGDALCDICITPESQEENSILVVEVSSFQLETIQEFKPYIAVLLNVSADHLDRYPDVEAYKSAKRRLLINLDEENVLVTNNDDSVCREFASETRAKVRLFSKTPTPEASVWYDNGEIFLRLPSGEEKHLCSVNELRLRGMHNVENVMAAAATALLLNVDPDSIRRGVTDFLPLEHRMEFVAAYDGIEFYNDSKATNLNSLEKALSTFDKQVILICGGKNKNEDFRQLAELAKEKVALAILIGEMAEDISRCWSSHLPCRQVRSVEEAVSTAIKEAHPGDIILFSPGCPSYDQYKNFEERGEDFKHCVMNYITQHLWDE